MDRDLEQRRIEMCQMLYLLYFNDYLLENGVISEYEHRLMDAQIRSRSSQKTKGKSKKLADKEHTIS